MGPGVVGGVSIDAQGMLHDTRTLSQNEQLKLLKQQAVGQPGSEKLAAGSNLRRVSLKRLEKTVQKLHKAGQNFARRRGISRRADGGRIHRLRSGAPGCDSRRPRRGLDATADGRSRRSEVPAAGAALRGFNHRAQVFLREAGERSVYGMFDRSDAERHGPLCRVHERAGGDDRSRIKQIFGGMEQAMGPQAVRLFGVEHSSRFALAMLAADYRLKRISLGHDPSPVKDFVNYLDLAAKTFHPGPQQQHRWWFQAKYDAILETPDHLAFQLIGQGVEVVTAPTSLAQQPGRKPPPKPRKSRKPLPSTSPPSPRSSRCLRNCKT